MNMFRGSAPVERSERVPITDEATSSGARPINCDQVAWMLDAIERYLPHTNYPSVSRAREMQRYALLYELMEVAYLRFADDAAKHNGTPPDVMRFQYASKLTEQKDRTEHERTTIGQRSTDNDAAPRGYLGSAGSMLTNNMGFIR